MRIPGGRQQKHGTDSVNTRCHSPHCTVHWRTTVGNSVNSVALMCSCIGAQHCTGRFSPFSACHDIFHDGAINIDACAAVRLITRTTHSAGNDSCGMSTGALAVVPLTQPNELCIHNFASSFSGPHMMEQHPARQPAVTTLCQQKHSVLLEPS